MKEFEDMRNRNMEFAGQPLLQDLQCYRLFYEVYPSVAEGNVNGEWFEVALHLEVAERRPHSHPENQRASLLLIEVADYLVQRVKAHAPFALDMPPCYYTLHPNPLRTALTLSLVFSNARPHTAKAEPAMLTQLRAELEHLGIGLFGSKGFAAGQCQR